jgi:hypothetical protein
MYLYIYSYPSYGTSTCIAVLRRKQVDVCRAETIAVVQERNVPWVTCSGDVYVLRHLQLEEHRRARLNRRIHPATYDLMVLPSSDECTDPSSLHCTALHCTAPSGFDDSERFYHVCGSLVADPTCFMIRDKFTK